MAKGDRKAPVTFGGRVPAEVQKAVRILAVKQDKSIQEVFEEALRDILKKYGERIPPRG